MSASPGPLNLLFRSDSHICALPLSHVVEILRPLRINPIASASVGVQGLAVVRGETVPVLDVATLLGGSSRSGGRWIVVRASERRVALSVDTVLGVRAYSPSFWSALPPLVGLAGNTVIDAVAALDEQLLLVLKTGGLVSDDVWESLPHPGA